METKIESGWSEMIEIAMCMVSQCALYVCCCIKCCVSLECEIKPKNIPVYMYLITNNLLAC